jgi:hypothetical protein
MNLRPELGEGCLHELLRFALFVLFLAAEGLVDNELLSSRQRMNCKRGSLQSCQRQAGVIPLLLWTSCARHEQMYMLRKRIY